MNSVCKLLTVLCATRQSGSLCQTPFWILPFACMVALNCQNTSQNACYGCEKFQSKFNDSKNSKNLNMIDTMWYNVFIFLRVNFGQEVRTLCARNLRLDTFLSVGYICFCINIFLSTCLDFCINSPLWLQDTGGILVGLSILHGLLNPGQQWTFC